MIILRVLLIRFRSRIQPEIGREQFGFVEDTGTRNAIFVLRGHNRESSRNAERCLHVFYMTMQKPLIKVRHQELFEDLDKLNLYRKDVHLLASLYWNQTACL